MHDTEQYVLQPKKVLESKSYRKTCVLGVDTLACVQATNTEVDL